MFDGVMQLLCLWSDVCLGDGPVGYLYTGVGIRPGCIDNPGYPLASVYKTILMTALSQTYNIHRMFGSQFPRV